MNNPQPKEWLYWMGCLVSAGVITCAYIFSNFESKADAKDRRDEVIMRLNVLQDKVDLIYQRMNK